MGRLLLLTGMLKMYEAEVLQKFPGASYATTFPYTAAHAAYCVCTLGQGRMNVRWWCASSAQWSSTSSLVLSCLRRDPLPAQTLLRPCGVYICTI
jgi:hypothetical protein